MISKHCNQKLYRLTPDYPAVSYHVWGCGVCGATFKQKRRQPNEKPQPLQPLQPSI